jgi:glycerol-3-phosphate dehydrogenase
MCLLDEQGTGPRFRGIDGRLAFLNAQAALEALPRVIDIMAKEKNWSRSRKHKEWNTTVAYLQTMGLPEKLAKLTRSQVERGDVAKFDNREDYRLYARHDGPVVGPIES